MIGLCLLIILTEIQNSVLTNQLIALLGILIAINAGLRFLENAIPGPAGFSPVFLLIILTGYCLGGKIGFLMGALTMLVSGLITGGIGPWLPGQMITAGWVGQTSGWLRILIHGLRWKDTKMEIAILAGFGAIWGMLFGLIMNLWFWPFLGTSSGIGYLQNGLLIENISRYFSYYLTTSILWDATRSIGNVLLLLLLSRSMIKLFERFSQRFSFKVTSTP